MVMEHCQAQVAKGQLINKTLVFFLTFFVTDY